MQSDLLSSSRESRSMGAAPCDRICFTSLSLLAFPVTKTERFIRFGIGSASIHSLSFLGDMVASRKR